jgi:AbrB family looped-hinge helix DNA binding protein
MAAARLKRQSVQPFDRRRRKTLSYPLVRTTISSKGQLVLPAELRHQDGIEAGQEFEIERIDRGEYRIVRRTAPPNEGLVDWLLACPEKGYFVPIESESTDSL